MIRLLTFFGTLALLTFVISSISVRASATNEDPGAEANPPRFAAPAIAASPVAALPATLAPAASRTVELPTEGSTSDLVCEPRGDKTEQAAPAGDAVSNGPGTSFLHPQEQSLREILELRREQDSLFEGTIFEQYGAEQTEGQFLEALRKAANVVRSEPSRSPPLDLPRRPSIVGPEVSLIPVGTPMTRNLVASLRDTSRQLDWQAADLEDDGDYAAADRLRRLAARLRREARHLTRPMQLDTAVPPGATP